MIICKVDEESTRSAWWQYKTLTPLCAGTLLYQTYIYTQSTGAVQDDPAQDISLHQFEPYV